MKTSVACTNFMYSLKQGIKDNFPAPVVNLLTLGAGLIYKQKVFFRRIRRLIAYSGDSVVCPFCEKSFSRFRHTGALDRPFWKSPEGRRLLQLDYINVPDALCPWCGSSERHRALYFYLRDRLRILEAKGIKLLDVAPDGFITDKFFCNGQLDYVSVDISPSRNPVFVMNITDMNFGDSTFDAIICYHVLEHIPNDIDAIKELYRVLKPSGWALIQVPVWAERTFEDASIGPDRYLEAYGHSEHVRRCGPDYVQRLEDAGFQVKEDDFISKFPKEKIHRYGLFETEKIWFCEKA